MFLRTSDAHDFGCGAYPSPAIETPHPFSNTQISRTPALHFRTAIISDLHLGRRAAFPEYLLEFLQNVTFGKLIINGDGFDGLNYGDDIPELHKRCVDALLAFAAKGGELVYIPGNHDEEATIGKTLRLKSRDRETEFKVQVCERHEHTDARGYINLVRHGHQDDGWHHNRWMKKLADVADTVYEPALTLSQAFRRAAINRAGLDISLIAPLKYTVKKMVGVAENLRHSMHRELESGRFKKIFCGHTHHAELLESTGNSGNFVEDGNFLAETSDGNWKLFNWAEVRKEIGLGVLPKASDPNPQAAFRPDTDRIFSLLCALYPKNEPAGRKRKIKAQISHSIPAEARLCERAVLFPHAEMAPA